MNNSGQKKLDQSSTNSSMENSTAMTIEFLRARLLAERAVSKSARQRADELVKRVSELEEQLRTVSLQRMQAEKATANVLAILESNGISDVSETFDLSSDQDIPCESKVGSKSSKEKGNSVNSKERKNGSEELSGSDVDFSPVSGRSLSWKGHKDIPRSLEKYKDPSVRRRSNISSAGSSPKHRHGKSCRQIRRKESKSVAEGFQANPVKVGSPENGVAATSDVSPNYSDAGPMMLEEDAQIGEVKTPIDGLLSDSVENGQNASGNDLAYSVYGKGDMEKALEHQAQLIGQFEEMEKAQREWEEKFRENNNSTPDSCDPGNRSDITEERYEIKAQAPHTVVINASQIHAAKPEVENLAKIQNNGVLSQSHVDVQFFEEQRSSNTLASESPTQDFAFSVAEGKKNQESIGQNYHPPTDNSHHHTYSHNSHDSLGSQPEPIFPSNTDGDFNKRDASGSQNERKALVPHEAHNELGGVLEALKQARQSLEQRINRLPLVESGPVGKSVEPSSLAMIPGDKMEIPVGCVGLFRLPSELSTQGNTRANFLSSSARLSLGNYYPDSDTGVQASVRNQFVTSPYLRTRSSFATEDQFLGSQYLENESRIPTQKPFDPYMNGGWPSSTRDSRDPYAAHPQDRFPSGQYIENETRIPTQKPFDPYIKAGLPSSSIEPGDTYSSHPLNEDRFLGIRYMENASRISMGQPIDSYMNAGLPFPSRESIPKKSRESADMYPSHLNNPYPGMTPRIPIGQESSSSLPSRIVGTSPANNFSFNDQIMQTQMQMQMQRQTQTQMQSAIGFSMSSSFS